VTGCRLRDDQLALKLEHSIAWLLARTAVSAGVVLIAVGQHLRNVRFFGLGDARHLLAPSGATAPTFLRGMLAARLAVAVHSSERRIETTTLLAIAHLYLKRLLHNRLELLDRPPRGRPFPHPRIEQAGIIGHSFQECALRPALGRLVPAGDCRQGWNLSWSQTSLFGCDPVLGLLKAIHCLGVGTNQASKVRRRWDVTDCLSCCLFLLRRWAPLVEAAKSCSLLREQSL